MPPIFTCDQRRTLFHTLFKHTALSMAVVFSDGSFALVSRAFCEFLGYSEAELLRLNLFDVTFPGDRELTQAHFCKLGDEREAPFEYEKRYLRKDGGVAWGLVSGAWIDDGAEGPYGMAFIQDVTAAKESEIALKQSQERFRAVFENAAAGIYTLSPKGRFLQVNRALCRLLGYAETELPGTSIETVTFADDLELTRRTIREALSKPPHSWHYEKRYRRKDGSLLWVQVSGVWQLDEDGLPSYAIGLVQDISEGKRAQEALHARKARYRHLFEANPLPMWIFDLENLRFLAVNDAAVFHYGYSREEFLTMTIKDIRPEGGEVQRLLESLAETKNDAVGEFRGSHMRRDGSLMDVEIHARRIEFKGRTARIVVVHDVTEKRRVQERMRLDAAALMSTRDAVLIVDRAPCIISVNPAFTEMTGYNEAEIFGEHPRVLSSSRRDRVSFMEIWESLRKDSFWQGEIWGRRKDGETFPGWLTLSTVRNAEGEATHFVGVITDLTKLKRSEERLQHLFNHDALTDLPRRQLLESMLEHALERARREKRQVALLVLDFDQFKAINESFGHKTGDDLLISVVERLRKRVRIEDALSRIAGDRFALMLEGIRDYSDVEVVARDLHAALEAPFLLWGGQQVELRASVGISIYPQDGSAAHDLLRGADAAVNLAKERGGNQFCYCTPELNAQARMRLELQSALRQALERKEFVLHYQPKVDLNSGRITGAEALLRWDSPERGMIPPLQFIPIAERSGLIVPIGSWVIEEACRQMRQWRDAGLEGFSISVNVSAQQFRTGKLEDQVSAALQSHGLNPQCLILELTESMLMDDPEEAIRLMSALRRIGVQISLDDFGIGYSSLEYLGRFPIDQLKIDRSFIRNIGTDPNSATISTSVIALAHRMRLKVVAEGVETEAQLGYLRQNGCDEMQGFYFSKPVRAEEFAGQLRQGKSIPSSGISEERNLLIVDDDPKVLSALRRVLFEEDFRVITAGSAQEGLDLAAGKSVQVVITDLRMPGMSGAEFLKQIKALHPDTVRMVLSEYADLPTLMGLVNESDIYRLLTKPWDNEQLRRHVRDAFDLYDKSLNPRQYFPLSMSA